MAPVDPGQHTFHSEILHDVVQEAVGFFVNTPILPLPPATKFGGTGVYALYHTSPHGLYWRLGELYHRNRHVPIYVGQASSSGVRQGLSESTDTSNHQLWGRLNEHARSIWQAGNLSLEDFRCRFVLMLRTEHGLIRTVETELIRIYTPLWNSYVDGFGIHDPGKGRRNQEISEWDSIHPGRSFVSKMESNSQPTAPILERIRAVLENL